MEGTIAVVFIILFVLNAAAVSRRIQTTSITLPMLYTVFGLILSEKGLGLINVDLENEFVQIIAELTLVLVLATDASRINLHRVRKDHNLPTRLLVIGLPLTMIMGTAVAFGLFSGIPFWEAAIIGIMLSPTDASLGLAVVTNPKVPVRIRQTLNIESGLNDGIAMPFLLMAISFAAAETSNNPGFWFTFAGKQVVLGILAGVVVGFFGVKLLQWGQDSGWMSIEFQKISALSIGLLAYGAAEIIGGNGFIAAFVTGATAGHFYRGKRSNMLYEFAEVEVQFMMMLTFMIVFGAIMLPTALNNINGTVLLYALLSLTIIRILPVAISMAGAKISWLTINFLGWFGPRGIASILYLFTVLEEENLASTNLIYTAVLITVLLSILFHGITAVPGAAYYSKHLPNRINPEAPEMSQVPEIPMRHTGFLK